MQTSRNSIYLMIYLHAYSLVQQQEVKNQHHLLEGKINQFLSKKKKREKKIRTVQTLFVCKLNKHKPTLTEFFQVRYNTNHCFTLKERERESQKPNKQKKKKIER